jgi:hypothetical protein
VTEEGHRCPLAAPATIPAFRSCTATPRPGVARIPASMLADFGEGGRLVVRAASLARQRVGDDDARFVALGDRVERDVYLR